MMATLPALPDHPATRRPRPSTSRSSSTRHRNTASLDKPLYISAFRQEDGSYNIVWSRPTRRREAPTDTVATDDGLPPLPGTEQPAAPVGTDGLGESSAEGAFGGSEPAPGGRRRRTPEMAD